MNKINKLNPLFEAMSDIDDAIISEAAPAERKRPKYFKPLMMAAAAVVASMATMFTVNAATNGSLVKFLFKGEEYSADTCDYIDEDGFRHVTFDAVVPIEAESFAVIFDVDEPDYEKAVRVLTDESDPEFLEKLRAHEEYMQTVVEIYELREVGIDAELPEVLQFEDFGIVLKDSEICIYEVMVGKASEDGYSHHGAFMTAAHAAKRNVGTRSVVNFVNVEDGTRTIHEEIEYYVGLD